VLQVRHGLFVLPRQQIYHRDCHRHHALQDDQSWQARLTWWVRVRVTSQPWRVKVALHTVTFLSPIHLPPKDQPLSPSHYCNSILPSPTASSLPASLCQYERNSHVPILHKSSSSTHIHHSGAVRSDSAWHDTQSHSGKIS
jgi:hypothetical protein